MTDYKPFNPQDYANEFANQSSVPVPGAVPPLSNPVNATPQFVQPSSPSAYAPPAQPSYNQNQGYQNQGYGGNGKPKKQYHFYAKLVKNSKTGKDQIELAISQAGWQFMAQNVPGDYKMRFSLWDNEYQTVKQTGQGYGGNRDNPGRTLGCGFFVLNSKGWNKRRGQQGGQGYQPNNNGNYGQQRW